MIEIKTITEKSTEKQILDSIENRVFDLKRQIFKVAETGCELKKAPVIRMIQIQFEELEKEIGMLKKKIF